MKIGVVLPISERDGVTPAYAEIRAYGRRAEQLGFDSIWLFDHLLFRRPSDPTTHGIWECWTLLTALAEATTSVELGTVVLCLPFRNPALLAKMAVTLDEVSGGRLILGLGAGWHQPEFDAFGFPFDHLASRFEEPILVASSGPRMLRLTAEHADMWNAAWFGPVDGVAEPRAALDQACATVGRDSATLAVTVGVSVAFPEPGEEAPQSEKVLTGSAEAMAAELRRYEESGVAHLICSIAPRTEAALERLREAVRRYREG
jgi:alkanesulfonate monooxygenase SsuD/methylene tetrahydromethanopterin reductase-like flavin-dependent oxidoreductase (luciferase family)